MKINLTNRTCAGFGKSKPISKIVFVSAVLLTSTSLAGSAMAATIPPFDFDNYQGTLSKEGLLPPIGSGYDLRFEVVENPNSEADYKLVTYTADADGNLTPIYYNYTYELKADAEAIKKPQLNNSGTIDDANGYYFGLSRTAGNCAMGGSDDVCGGAIYSTGTINNLIGDFIGNYASGSSASGGAISNTGTITSITGDFIANYATSSGNYAQGGAIYNEGAGIGEILNSSFIGNYAKSETALGGAISNYGVGIGKILNSSFIGNYAKAETGNALGGAIYSQALIEKILNSSFIGNYAKAETGTTQGGAIFNSAGIGEILNSSFIGNYATASADYAQGGAIFNGAEISVILNSSFIGNYVTSSGLDAQGGAIYNTRTEISEILNSSFIGNYAKSETGNAYGGAIDNRGGTISKILNSSFIGNYAKSDTGTAKGGAIWSNKDIFIEADNGLSEFTGNYVEAAGVKTSNAIYMSSISSTLNLNSIHNGVITFNDAIDGVDGYKIELTGDDTGAINFNNHIKNAIINQDSGNTSISKVSYLNNNNTLNINGGNFSLHTLDADVMTETTITAGALTIADLGVKSLNFNNLHLNGGQVNVKNMSVDLQSGAMGSIWASTISGNSTKFVVENINILKDDDGDETSIEFSTNKEINNNLSSNVTSALGPVFDYGVSYDPTTGDFTFVRQEVNPEVMTPSVAAVAAVSVLSDEIYSRVLSDIDTPCGVAGCTRKVGGAFVKTFGSDDSVDLKNFSGADVRFDGIIGGIESERINEGRGISAIYNAYAAYANGESKFAGEEVNQNAYYLGVGATFYKGNGFLGTTANLATVRNQAKTIDGKDKFSSYLAGAAFKLGYNYEVFGLIVQPNLYGSYTFINSNDYTTGRGAKVEFDNMYTMELAPGLKVAKEFEGGLTSYLKARYVHSFNEGQEVHANGFLLPEISLKPYVEYGLGVEKNLDQYSGFAEITRRDGGREGWNGIVGLKYHW